MILEKSLVGSPLVQIVWQRLQILYDIGHVAWWDPYNLRDLARIPRLDLYYADPAQPLTTAGEELDDLQ